MKNVFNLIANMSSAEKMMFTKLEVKNRSKSFYELYKIFNSTPDFKKLKLKIESIKNLNYETHNLYTRLLRAITIKSMFYADKTEKLTSELVFCKELKEKGLYSLALKKLKKLKSIAKSIEHFSLLITISNLEEEICYSSFDTRYFSNVEMLLGERFYYSKQIDLISKLKFLKYKLIELQYEKCTYVSQEELEQIFGEKLKLLETSEEGLSVKAKGYLYACKWFKFLFARNETKTLHYACKCIELIESHKNILEIEYCKALNNAVFSAIVFEHDTLYNEMMKKLENYKPKIEDYAIKKYCELYLKLKWCSRKNNYSLIKEIEGSFMFFVKEHSSALNQTQIDSLHLSFINVLLKCGNIELANQILSDWRLTAIENYSLPYYYMCSMYVHLLLDNFTLVESFFESITRNKSFPLGLIQLAKILRNSEKHPHNIELYIQEVSEIKNANETYFHFVEIDVFDWIKKLKIFYEDKLP